MHDSRATQAMRVTIDGQNLVSHAGDCTAVRTGRSQRADRLDVGGQRRRVESNWHTHDPGGVVHVTWLWPSPTVPTAGRRPPFVNSPSCSRRWPRSPPPGGPSRPHGLRAAGHPPGHRGRPGQQGGPLVPRGLAGAGLRRHPGQLLLGEAGRHPHLQEGVRLRWEAVRHDQ